MTGLDKILNVINADAQAKAEAIISQASEEALKIQEEAKIEAEKKCKEIATKTESEMNVVMSRAQSTADLQKKKMLLLLKQEIIAEMIQSARASLDQLSNDEYTGILLRMIKSHAHSEAGEILLSSYDKVRLPANFTDLLANALQSKSGAHLTISKDLAPFKGGFLLKYGDIEENCSIDALFNSAKEDLQDMVNKLLFES